MDTIYTVIFQAIKKKHLGFQLYNKYIMKVWCEKNKPANSVNFLEITIDVKLTSLVPVIHEKAIHT